MNLDATFRHSLSPSDEGDALGFQLPIIVAGGAWQGALMGSYALWNGGSVLFSVWGALKVPLLLGLAGALCLPVLRVLSLLLGIGDEFQTATRALLGVQVAFASVLVALSPLIVLYYASGASYRGALAANMAVWVFAALVAGWRAKEQLAPQLRREKRLRFLGGWGFALWAFVAIQTGWCLRPFLGRPDAPPQFLRKDALSNAYLGLWKMATPTHQSRSTPTRRDGGN
ncbi:hypothetical protein IAD21_04247 [Abditibacteriota bacterium]|nr:hypothetical protein IAD21_04247 [Abditibacteriota bacterium]